MNRTITTTHDPLESSDMLKIATIYRNSEMNYIFVCYHCGSSFTNSLDILSHVDNHFDSKVNITTEFVSTTDEQEVTKHLMVENDNQEMFCDDFKPVGLSAPHQMIKEKLVCEEEEDEGLSECKFCKENFDSSMALLMHLLKTHINEAASCPQCSRKFVNEISLLKHVQQHVSNNELTLDALLVKTIAKCRSSFVTQSAVKVESDTQTVSKTKSVCRVLPKTEFIARTAPKTDSVRRPLAQFQIKSLKTCDICLKTFSSRKNILRHMREKHMQPKIAKRYECEKCNRQINGTNMFYAHQYGHLTYGDKVNEIDDEELKELLKTFLNDNIIVDESAADETFVCRLCSRVTLTGRHNAEIHILQRHVYFIKKAYNRNYKRKFAAVPLSCSICNKTFAHKAYLRSHEIIHSELKPHQCSICGSVFKTITRLHLHSRIHLDAVEKCTTCGKEIKAHNMRHHVRTVHESEHRPFSCSVCLQTFKTAKTLKNHSYRHTNEKNYQCRFDCKEKFISSSARRAHERSRHESVLKL